MQYISERPDVSRLVEYGVHAEQSTHRAHVDLESGYVICFTTAAAVAALPEPIRIKRWADLRASGYELIMPHWAKGKVTARGIRLSHRSIEGATCSAIPFDLKLEYKLAVDAKTSEKGRCAEAIVKDMRRRGILAVPEQARDVHDLARQKIGVDYEVQEQALQVKYDAGCFRRGVFLQTHEYNPNSDH